MTTISQTFPPQKKTLPPFLRYVLYRTTMTVFLIFGVTVVTFTLTNLVPADPIQAALGEQAAANPEIVEEFRRQQGLDKPVPVQYLNYMGRLLQGDLGTSIKTHNPVSQDLARAFPATVELALSAITISIVFGIGLGLIAALKRRTFWDQLIRILSIINISLPSFWLALIAYYIFFSQLHLFPGSGRLSPTLVAPPKITGMYTVDSLLAGNMTTFFDAVHHLILPASVLAFYTIGLLTRFTRTSILEVLDLEYVRSAHAKGLSSRKVVFSYVLRGAFVPILTVVGLAFGSLLSGTVLVEKIYSWNGLGQYAFMAATSLDVPAIMGVGLIVGCVYVGLNLLVDVSYGLIDPRVRKI